MIKSTDKQALKAARRILDAESGKPDTSHVHPCVCGAFGITVADDDNDLVQCTACGAVRSAAGCTLRVVREFEADGAWYADVGAGFENRVKSAKTKPDKDKSDTDKTLAKVDVDGKPKPKDKAVSAGVVE